MSTLATTIVKHPSSSINNIALDSSGKTLLGSTFTGQSTAAPSPDGGARTFRIGSGEPGTLLTSDMGTAGTTTGTQTAVASVGLSYFGAVAPTDLCITNGANTVASNIRVYNNGSQVAQWTPTGDFQFNSGYGSVATAYGCRAWVNFNGTGTVAIRGSGNVSSITDNGVGNYTVNFTTAMPDTNYSVPASAKNADLSAAEIRVVGTYSLTTTSVGINTVNHVPAFADSVFVHLAIFR
jgi:hypothetical protein